MTNVTEKITLKVIKNVRRSHINIEPIEFVKAEEGDTVGPFKITEKTETSCEHDEVRWDIENKNSTEVPDITGNCPACGATLKAETREVEVVEE